MIPTGKFVKYDILYRDKHLAGENGWNDIETDHEVLEWIELLFNIPNVSEGKLLEVGCGAGNLSIYLNKNFVLTCLDVSAVAIAWAQERFKNQQKQPEFVIGDIINLTQFSSASFDYVLDSLCLHFLVGQQRSQALKEINRVLKSKGFLFVVSMCGDPKNKYLKANFNTINRYVEFDEKQECYFGYYQDILEELTFANFEIYDYRVIKGLSSSEDMLLAIGVKK